MEQTFKKSVWKPALKLAFLLSALLTIHTQTSTAQEPETLILKVMVNEEDKGEHIFLLSGEDVVLFPRKTLIELGFNVRSEKALKIGAEEYISLKSLAPRLTYRIDEEDLTLYMKADPRLLQRHVVDFAYEPTPYERTRDNSAFLNYSVNYTYDVLDTGDSFSNLRAPTELGARLGHLWLYSSALYTWFETADEPEQDFVRMMSNITIDDTTNLRRYILGDFQATTGEGGRGVYGGLSIAKNFSIRPQLITFPTYDITGLLETPSEVEVWVNGMRVKKESLSPGEFYFFNLPITTGAGAIKLVIRDAFGRERVVTEPFYASSRLLKPGLHQYSYNIGFKREDLGIESANYKEDPALLAFHRVGITDSFTAGMRLEADQKVSNFGLTFNFLPWTLGELTMSGTGSYNNETEKYGYSGSLQYVFSGRGAVNMNLLLKGYSRDYHTIDTIGLPENMKMSGNAGIGINLGILGSVSGSYSMFDRYEGTDQARATIFYSKQIGGNFSLIVSANRLEERDDEETVTTDEAFIGVHYTMSGDRFASLDAEIEEDRLTNSLILKKNPPTDRGFGYRFEGSRMRDEAALREEDKERYAGEGRIQYYGYHGTLEAGYNRSYTKKDSYNAILSGSLAVIGGGAYLSKPIYDSFALVKAGEVEGIKVKYSNQDMGTTNSDGELLVPGLISYDYNKISIDPTALPLEYLVEETEKTVSPPYRSGSVVDFSITKFQAVEGVIYFSDKGKKIPAEYAQFHVETDKETIETYVGAGGAFYLENIPMGRFSARVFDEQRDCRFDLVIPKSDELITDLGEIICGDAQ